MRNTRILFIFLFVLVLSPNLLGQDRLLLTNGKIKKLKGVVVYYDHDLVLYQNDRQAERMQLYELEKKNDQTVGGASIRKDERNAAKLVQEQQKAQGKLETKRKIFEEEVKDKMERLSPADFEKWKNRELNRLKSEETKQNLATALSEKFGEAKINRKEARKRGRFSKRVSRDLVFAILKKDSTEIVIYNADTLGFFADGDAELEYGVTEMRLYIKGRQDGRKHRTAFDATMGAGVGTLSAFLGAFYGPIGPATYIIVMTVANTKMKKMAVKDPELLIHPAYRDGYDRSAKHKKTLDFIKGSVAGLGFGFLMWQGIFR